MMVGRLASLTPALLKGQLYIYMIHFAPLSIYWKEKPREYISKINKSFSYCILFKLCYLSLVNSVYTEHIYCEHSDAWLSIHERLSNLPSAKELVSNN